MHQPRSRRWIAATVGVLAALWVGGRAHACVDETTLRVAVAVAVLTPSDVGVAVPLADAGTPRLDLGWSWQFPLGGGHIGDSGSHHRIVPAIDLLPHAGGASWRGRLGYRYSRRRFFAGAGLGIEGAGLSLSPEIGVKFAHALEETGAEVDPSLHLLARADIAPGSGRVRGGSVLLGWNIF